MGLSLYLPAVGPAELSLEAEVVVEIARHQGPSDPEMHVTAEGHGPTERKGQRSI